MKTIFLLLGIGFISLQGFADPSGEDKKSDENSKIEEVLQDRIQRRAEVRTQYNQKKAQWLSRLNDKSSWRKRAGAVKDWKTVFLHAPEEVFSQLALRLSDKSQKVRDAVVTVFEEMVWELEFPEYFLDVFRENWVTAAESDHFSFKLRVIEALAQRRSNDTNKLFLRKTELASEVFKRTSLYTVLEDEGGSLSVFEEVGVSGADQVLAALYEMAEAGLSDKKNMEKRKAALQLLDVILDKLISVKTRRGLFVTSKAEDQVSDYILKGVQIAVTGLTDRKPEIQLAAKDRLNRTFQTKSLSYVQVTQIIPHISQFGFFHSSPEVRKDTIDLLVEIATLYPALNAEVIIRLRQRQAKENSLSMKVALKRALKQLTNSGACREQLSG